MSKNSAPPKFLLSMIPSKQFRNPGPAFDTSSMTETRNKTAVRAAQFAQVRLA